MVVPTVARSISIRSVGPVTIATGCCILHRDVDQATADRCFRHPWQARGREVPAVSVRQRFVMAAITALDRSPPFVLQAQAKRVA